MLHSVARRGGRSQHVKELNPRRSITALCSETCLREHALGPPAGVFRKNSVRFREFSESQIIGRPRQQATHVRPHRNPKRKRGRKRPTVDPAQAPPSLTLRVTMGPDIATSKGRTWGAADPRPSVTGRGRWRQRHVSSERDHVDDHTLVPDRLAARTAVAARRLAGGAGVLLVAK